MNFQAISIVTGFKYELEENDTVSLYMRLSEE